MERKEGAGREGRLETRLVTGIEGYPRYKVFNFFFAAATIHARRDQS